MYVFVYNEFVWSVINHQFTLESEFFFYYLFVYFTVVKMLNKIEYILKKR
jgi:hypothetical protein